MKGLKPDEFIREPFVWSAPGKDPMQTKWEEPKYSVPGAVVPLDEQKQHSESLYNFYKNWITYRNSHEIMTLGQLETTPFHYREVVSLIRTLGDKKSLALHNVSDIEVTVLLAETPEFTHLDFATASTIIIQDNQIKLPAHSSAVITN